MRINSTVKLFRNSSPSGLRGSVDLELVNSRVPAWLRFQRSVIITAEGMEALSDGSARFHKTWDIEEGDVIQLQKDSSKRYRIEGVNELYTAGGSLLGYNCSLIRDSSVE